MAMISSRTGFNGLRTVTGGWAVVEALEAEGVEAVFGIPGVHNLPIYDALADGSTIRHYLARHEQGAGFMADAYARSSGRVGIVLATTGPGVTNSLTALANAYADSVPLVLITTTVATPGLAGRQGALHELKDQHALLANTVEAALQAERVEEIGSKVREAFRLARGGRPRPVAVEVPVDVLASEYRIASASLTPSEKATLRNKVGSRRRGCNGAFTLLGRTQLASLRQAAEMLRLSSHPLIYAGGGSALAGAEAEVRELAELLRAPVLTTEQGKGIIPEDHPLSLGTSWRVEPAPGTYSDFLQRSDLWLAVGTTFDSMNTAKWGLPVSDNLIQIDLDPGQVGRNYPVRVGIHADAKWALEELLCKLRAQGTHESGWEPGEIAAERRRQMEQGLRRSPQAFRLLEQLRRALGQEGLLALDSAIPSFWAARYYPSPRPRSLLFSGIATLGYGLPAAIGAKVAFPNRPVAALAGDGGFLFTVEELAAATQAGLSIPIVLVNDQRFGMIKYVQREEYAGRYIAVDLANPDFVKLAQAFGARGYRLENVDALADTMADALAARGPTVIEVPLTLEPPVF